ncbi:MAG: phosphogluconate dehydrogenase (NADP(+)-dependent, decarboxylating) [Anaerolineales bacterium]|nr:decarboxylating NADP(+)-dependent phosphogluconate dehydrogenase [Anaerolineae bacterium]PWB56583.1 MAG: phosphogluconate dehydrogenase (NADP(+)-dependent, decarboxylating) [Anaerolineales bacterium]
MDKADLGLIGLAVMGQNLVMNMNDHGFKVAVFNRTTSKVDDFLKGPARRSQVIGTHSLEELINSLTKPRRVMLMIQAGKPVDDFIDLLIQYLEPGDIIIDGGNSNYNDTIRRTAYVESKGLYYVGTGVSGGEEGARHGPSIMPGGSAQAWPHIKPIFQAIAAKVKRPDGGEDACCDWVGENGAGHYVKMVHNGIEYGDMQLICEAYQLMHEGLGLSADKMSVVFKEWNKGKLESYLIEITGDILAYKDEDDQPLVDKILDVAEQKGTGKWTGISALDMGVPLTMVVEAVFGRALSSLKDERTRAAKALSGPHGQFKTDPSSFISDLEQAVYASKIMSYTQGYMLFRAAAQEYHWNLNYGGIALMWRGGCIIRSAFLGKIKEAFEVEPALENLLLAPYFTEQVTSAQAGWRRVVEAAVKGGIPVPAMSSALAFFDGYRHARLPANLLQAQRDYFGAHTYQRVDRPRGEYYHTNWTGHGGQVTSTVWKKP